MTEDGRRYVYLDNIRNILVYSVVFFHAALIFAYPMTFWWPVVDKAASSRIYETFIQVCSAFQMPILMFIAVLFIFPSLKKNTVPGYLKKRFLRLMVPVFVYTACGADIFYQIRYKQAGLDTMTYFDTFLGFWKDLFFGPGLVFMSKLPFFNPSFKVGPTWFMSFLFAATLVIAFFSRLKKGEKSGPVSVESAGRAVFKTAMIFLAFTFAYIAGIIALTVNEIGPADWLRLGGFLTAKIDQAMQLALFILLGLYAHKKQWLTKKNSGSWTYWIAASLLFLVPLVVLQYTITIPSINKVFVVVDHNLFNNDYQRIPALSETFKLFLLVHYVLVLWFCFSLLMAFISLSKRFFNRPNMITSFCSKHSIYVYVLHIVPVMVLQYALKDMAMPSLLKVALITFIVVCACLWLSHRLVYLYPKAAIAFFVGLKAAALLAGFTFYYYALLLLISVAFVGAMIEGTRYFLTVNNKGSAILNCE